MCTKSDDIIERMSLTICLEQLPVELLLKIFSYLEGYDLINAFANLNTFYDCLLHSPQLSIHVSLNENTIEFPAIFIANIRSLRDESYDRYVHRFLDLHISQLNHLQSLTINADDFENSPIISILPKLIHLEYLNIRFGNLDKNSNVLSVIFALPKLRFCIVNAHRRQFTGAWINDSTPLNQFITHFNIQTRIETSCLHGILLQLPSLHSLQVTYLTQNTHSLLPENNLPNLRMITFRDTNIKMSDFDEILQKLPNLQLISAGPVRAKSEKQFEELLLNPQWTKPFDRIKQIDIEIQWSFMMTGRIEDMHTNLPQSHPWLTGPVHQYFDGNDDEHIFTFYINFNRNMARKNKCGMEREIF
ncbi:hypothetical protein I4U23_011505 [Adineta vaga]|nr:hypothetical protein I4U23_011505 [Adineta vaga]